MSPRTLEFFFDLSSPWTYLAFRNVRAVLQRTGAGIRYRPILVGGVFNAVNPAVYAARQNPDDRRMRQAFRVLHDWAEWSGVPLRFPSQWHPARSVLAMRMAAALEEDQTALAGFADEAFTAYFVREENLDDPTVLASVATRAGLDGEQLLSLAATEPVKGRLRANTEELVARGGFGSPSMFVGDKLFFGNDQLPVAEQELRRVPLWKE
jgi:2-hydroxychromene-2-carboxylate isomerase